MSAIVNNGPLFNAGPNVDEDEIDLGELLGVLIESRWLIVVVATVIFLLGVAYTFVATPIYQADGLLQVEEKKGAFGDLDFNAFFEGDALVSAEIEILGSRSVLGTVVDNLSLDIIAEPKYVPIIGAALARRNSSGERPMIQVDSFEIPDALLGRFLELVVIGTNRYQLNDENDVSLFRGVVGETATASWSDGESVTIFVSALQAEKDQVFVVRRASRLGAIRALQGRLSVSEQGEWSGILAISLKGPNPESIQRQVNEIANVYVRQNVERRSAEAQQTLNFLDKQLPAVRADVETAELALNSYRLEKGSIDLPLETQSILQTIVSVEGQLNEVRQEREKVTLAFTPAHPTVIALDRQIEQFNGELAQLNSQVRDLPTTQQELLRLIRDVEVNTVLYTSLLNTAQELRVVKAGTVGNVRVVDYAVLPFAPISPNKLLVLLFAFVVGSVSGVVVAFARKALKAGVEDPDLIEKRVNIPVYATIAHSKRQDQLYKKLMADDVQQALLVTDSPDDIAIESLRNLQTALHFGTMDAKNNCIMIAGPSPGVGKSFVSVNLAAVLTNNGKKVLLVDGDMRRGHLHKYLGIDRANGLSDFISGDIPIGQVLHHTSVPGLTLIPTGNLPPNPVELLFHQRFSNCLSVLIPRYDHIIIDSPPILAATDASIIGQIAGATLMVIKSGEHPMREIEQSVKCLQRAGVNLRGLLINDMTQNRRYGAGKYSYQYGYDKG